MKNLWRLRAGGQISQQQFQTACAFYQGTANFRLPQRLREILRAAIIDEIPLGQIERSRGWPARSAKAIISEILLVCEDLGWSSDPKPLRYDEKEVEQYLHDEIGAQIVSLADRYALSRQQAVLAAMLERRIGKAVTYETLVCALWPDANEPENARGVIGVVLCKLRRKLSPHGIEILCVHGIGLKMLKVAE